MVKEGRVLRSYSGYYYVACDGQVYTCKIRGHMKKERFSLCTGDHVRFEAAGEALPAADGPAGMITEVLPRQNHLTRPTVANMDLDVVTMALADPAPSFLILDKLLVLAACGGVPALIVLTKADLVPADEAEAVARVYREIGYEVHVVSTRTGQGLAALKERLARQVTVVGGPSGVGKSTLLNALQPGMARAPSARKSGGAATPHGSRTWFLSMGVTWPTRRASVMSSWRTWTRQGWPAISGNLPSTRTRAAFAPAATRTSRSVASRTPSRLGTSPRAAMRRIKPFWRN